MARILCSDYSEKFSYLLKKTPGINQDVFLVTKPGLNDWFAKL